MNIKIREATVDDIEIIYNFICKLQNELFDIRAFEEIFILNLNNTFNKYLVAEVDGIIEGFLSYHTQFLLHHCGLVGEIQEFYVSGLQRGKGVGKKLFEKIKLYAVERNVKSLEVTSNKSRIENIRIYMNLGFIQSHNKFTLKLD